MQIDDHHINTLMEKSNAWPFEEARQLNLYLKQKYPDRQGDKKPVIFETGYGPSGFPHIGTFGEVVRTEMVRHAFERLTQRKTRLIVFSDDMDGLRKIPDNIENGEMLKPHLQKPLSSVPDPFGIHQSFGAHNNDRLKKFLDRFNFDYEFVSATQCYKSGMFDQALMRMLEIYDDVMHIMLPSLGDQRQKTYSPFLPICPQTGQVLYVPLISYDKDQGTIIYENASGQKIETTIKSGHCKLQWKPDWAMRWYALGVDYEMCGKDLIDTRHLSSKICQKMGMNAPKGIIYEHFLDENGEKISKSKGNGLTIDEWLRYAPQESLGLYMYNKPKTAKRLHFDVIPKCVDDYLAHARTFEKQPLENKLNNPLWHIHKGDVPVVKSDLNFSVLLNLVSVVHGADHAMIKGFLERYDQHQKLDHGQDQEQSFFDRLINFAIVYTHDFITPKLEFAEIGTLERQALETLQAQLKTFKAENHPRELADQLQQLVFETGKKLGYADRLRDWFKLLYRCFLGAEQGPKMGSFIALYGIEETLNLISQKLDLDQ
ncbi:MAG: lysine--tRNA ligase [Pseudomonadota bacterium]